MKYLKFDYKFIKFLFVGVFNTAFGYGIYALFLFLHFHYTIAAFLCVVLGILFNFKTTGTLVFSNHNNKLIYKFFIAYGILYLVNISFLKFCELLNIDMYIAGFLWLLPMPIISFTLMKYFVFKDKTEKKNNEKD